ncbi:MAG TPA: sterol desaturase family protein [Anaeromyxobacteraceae bacterium]|nr:sterol desaturase family protein [Anaeromyxobacteraceae bacterium]
MTRASREELRAELLARLPRRYSPWLQLAVPTLGCLAVAAAALSWIHDLRAWQLALVPLFVAFGNAVEWHAHRGLLHRRTRFVEVMYIRHSVQHHRLYVGDAMAIRTARELRFVLLPSYAVFAVLAVAAPIPVAFALAGQRNLAALWIASAAAYLLAYEWLHLLCHLPEDAPVARLAAVRALRRHHRLHHAPHLMQRWNFNVTLPLWDLVRGTLHRTHAQPAGAHAARSAR